MAKQYENIRNLLETNAESFKQRSAFSFISRNGEKVNVSYKRLLSDVNSLAAALVYSLKLEGEKIAIMSANCYEWCVTYLACLSGVGVAVPIDNNLSAEDVYSICDFADIRALVCDARAAELLSSFGGAGAKKPRLISYSANEGSLSFHGLIERGKRLIEKQADLSFTKEIDPDALAVLLFTSGTTGVSKGVMLSHKNLCADLFAVSDLINVSFNDRTLSILPLHHTYESIALLMMLSCGGTVCFCGGLRYLREGFASFSPTVFVTVPLILEKLHKKIKENIEKRGGRQRLKVAALFASTLSKEKKNRIFSEIHEFFGGKLEKIVVGAAELDKTTAEEMELFGFKTIIGYGLTECSPIIICNTAKDRTADTVGRPVPGSQAKILNPDEKGIGEIFVKGPMVTMGYYKNQKATEEAFSDGWFRTGDLGYIDKNGRYRITGRSKNVIVTKNGKNIYPEELEHHLLKNPYIKECIVYAKGDIICCEILPDEERIEKKLKKANPAEDEIKVLINEAVRGINRRLATFKRIRKVSVRKTEFPKTSTHKIKRI